ncbi:ATP-binding cassette domain-containing protein [uncultured Ruminococcus sp.]|uniref:ABC transporter ATP-binding protein n=1 Tax=uncultured Ruminococcus sp. TaxID=165186 RepID=UPI0025EB12F0|nr:ABC-F type ribosomal protection protein [uncultured Ruminococcus sp.]
MLVSLSKIHKYYNGREILHDVNLTINEGERIGLVGANGCGKTTLLRILTGKEEPDRFVEDDGVISRASKVTVGYLEQMGGLERSSTVYAEMRSVFADVLQAADRMRELEAQMHGGLEAVSEEYTRLTAFFESRDGYLIDVKIKTVLNGMGFGEDTYDRIISSFSGGEKTRLAIAKLLLEEPNLLILDEPTNHLDFQTVLWLEDYLKEYKGALLIVSHDRYFLDKLCTAVCEIEGGHLTRYKGNYTAFTRLKAEAVARQLKEYEAQQKEIAKLEDYVARNIVRATTAKSAQSRVKALERMERIEKPVLPQKAAKLRFTYETEPPFDLLQVQNIDVTVGSGPQKRTLVDSLSFAVKRGEKIGIIGENGIGKSTLLKVLLGRLPHRGNVHWTSNVKLSYFEQESTQLNPNNTVIDELHDRYPTMTDLEIRSLLGQVRMTGENVFKQIGVISGGERAKVCFALMMLEHGNVLILDEPTNHLDLTTKEVLEEALASYTGTILFVSHDRYLLNRISDKILEITPHRAELFPGNFDSYLEIHRQREQQAQLEADAERQRRAAEEAKERGAKVYRTREQRSREAQRRNRIRTLEQEIDGLEQELQELQEQLGTEQVCGDYKLMQQICDRIEQVKTETEEKFEELMELEDEA